MEIITFYQQLTRNSSPILNRLLARRLKQGKENEARLQERKGVPTQPRPEGILCWIHAASIGEAQSALILIKTLLANYKNLNILITSGTLTSSQILEKKLPERAFHQFYPLDHPDWIARFLDEWRPDIALWMESELWPNMLNEIGARKIPAVLINARLSNSSFNHWRFLKKTISRLLNVFSAVLCQTKGDALYFKKLGAHNVHVTDNLKYSALPLSSDEKELQKITSALQGRPCWIYASTHKGEETLATQTHEILKTAFPDLLTIIVPRHPERRDEIIKELSTFSLKIQLRGPEKNSPHHETDLYIVDTLGELGLFYRIAPIAFIGRSFSDDGGGGHNPIEAAQLGCAVLHGPNIRNLQEIFDEMDRARAAILIHKKEALSQTLQELLSTPKDLQAYQKTAYDFARAKEKVIEKVLQPISKILDEISASERAQ